MIWFLYNIAFAIGYSLMLPRYLLRMLRRGGYRAGFGQRFGRYPDDVLKALASGPRRVWVHAVSVGEIFVALSFIEALRAEHPETRFVLTTTTSTGHAIAAARMDAKDILLYFPLDFPGLSRRVLDQINPRAIILTESEFWPNLMRTAHARGIPILLINGRVSDSSYRGYKLVRPLFRRVAGMVETFCVQGQQDWDRLTELGAPAERVRVVGAAKYDMTDVSNGKREYVGALLATAGIGPDRPILLGGSTWPGEEKVLIDCFRRLRASHPELALVLVPRHVERARQIAAELRRSGFDWGQRSELKSDEPLPAPLDILLVDTTGELMAFYAQSTVIFVGKSLTRHGGQNVIEPSALAKPVVVGPNMENFVSIMQDFRPADAIVQVETGGQLEEALGCLLADGPSRDALGQRALSVVTERRGAVARSVEAFSELPLAEGNCV